jgi:hypothetical protein
MMRWRRPRLSATTSCWRHAGVDLLMRVKEEALVEWRFTYWQDPNVMDRDMGCDLGRRAVT